MRSLWVIAVFALIGCTGGYSFTGASIPPGAKTLSVAPFPNYASTVNPQLSQKLTDELRNMFQSQTSLNIVNGDADLEITGEITSYTTRASALTSGDDVSMNRLTITVRVRRSFKMRCCPTWKRMRHLPVRWLRKYFSIFPRISDFLRQRLIVCLPELLLIPTILLPRPECVHLRRRRT